MHRAEWAQLITGSAVHMIKYTYDTYGKTHVLISHGSIHTIP